MAQSPSSIVYSAGSNSLGQLASAGSNDSHTFGRCIFQGIQDGRLTGSKVLSIAQCANHSLLLLRKQEGTTELWGSGDGRKGQLGARYSQEFGASPVFHRIFPHQDVPRYADCDITLIAASWESSFVVLSGPDNDILLSSGGDDFGDLGVGGLPGGKKQSDKWLAVGFSHLLPKNTSNMRISDLKAGLHNVIVKLVYRDSDTRDVELLVGWGAARQGQLGQENLTKKPQPIVDSPRILRFPSSISSFAVGNQHAVFVASDGLVFPLGSNRKGQLAGLDSVKNICAVGATWNGTYLLQKHQSSDKRWSILATGSNSHGQLACASNSDSGASVAQLRRISLPTNVSEAESLSITCGSEHVLVASLTGAQVDDEMGVFAWGWNEHGNLGLGHTDDVHEPSRIWPPANLPQEGKVVGVWAGCATSWVVIEET
ncbi:RCC1/BLIP-II [Fomitiporia mediterranea MF3/22]|uniref:RCC1/BLIP-II n=1 Tax=Fomitiporia mediterranea (strain MF3/22) TaxID=694068 RepID=UPI000440930F|nr:RCC1/BLIP-II [Fomitiporia mediterranea MF3/22]EJD03543.1 RCC1/BLIP-II [Fomitiporia mediterranea MF3/22]